MLALALLLSWYPAIPTNLPRHPSQQLKVSSIKWIRDQLAKRIDSDLSKLPREMLNVAHADARLQNRRSTRRTFEIWTRDQSSSRRSPRLSRSPLEWQIPKGWPIPKDRLNCEACSVAFPFIYHFSGSMSILDLPVVGSELSKTCLMWDKR